MNDRLSVHGAREHNLKNVHLDMPRDAMVVFTGLSGSGKSSLAFDTIFAEGQRRYIESLSPYARQFLGQLDKPEFDSIEGLSPAVSIDQASTSRNPRSTVGTMTEIYDYLRLLWARIGHPHCPVCGEPVTSYTPQQIVDAVLELPEGTRFHLLAPIALVPIATGQEGDTAALFSALQARGLARVRVDGEIFALTDAPALATRHGHAIEVVVDRLAVRPTARQRLTDSVETALRLGGGRVVLDLVDQPAGAPGRELRFAEALSCPGEHPLAIDELEPRSFSFNSPFGACPACTGVGTRLEADPELVVPDGERSLADGAVAPWATGAASETFGRLLRALADSAGFDLDTPWDQLPATARQLVLHGTGDLLHVRYRNRSGRERSYDASFEGVLPWIERQHAAAAPGSASDKGVLDNAVRDNAVRDNAVLNNAVLDKYAGFMRPVPCPACGGARLRPEVLAVTVGGRSIAEVSALSIGELAAWLPGLRLTPRESLIGDRVLAEIRARLEFLGEVGLGYLSLDRPAGTLAGGEAQRIRLATQLGSGLAGVLYVLDEPTTGLHQRDVAALLGTLQRLRNLGNTLIVVEHDQDIIAAADWIVDIGPEAGERGGQILVSGTLEDLKNSPESVTGAYLSGRREIPVPATRRPASGELVIRGAREHNLRDVDAALPLGSFVAVTGVSGSGKSSLVSDILYPALMSSVNGAARAAGRHKRVTGMDQLDKVVGVDQSPIGRTPRSSPATYTGVFDHIRRLFAQTPEAKVRGYQPGRFSFNVKGGRCENCAGDGTVAIAMNFLPDVYVPCEACQGARYNRDTLEVRYKGKTISEVLDMPVAEAVEFFAPVGRIERPLAALVQVGLGYVRLGQPATTLSGGEAQRVKLAAELQRRSTGATIYVLDEPTAGLHPEDVRKLLGVLHALVDQGNTVVVVEHDLDVIKTADWVIDLGPGGGPDGGLIVAEGTPEQVASVEESHTGRFLRPVLDRARASSPQDWPQAA